jgi:hypothetical protein
MTDCIKPNYEGLDKIQTYKPTYIFNNDRKSLKTIDGSVQADIVVNAEDKEAVQRDNEECSETKKLLDEERETKREMYYRQARILYPEKEEYVLSLAIDAFMELQEKGIDITTHKFDNLTITPATT